jgi:hypothetical protein
MKAGTFKSGLSIENPRAIYTIAPPPHGFAVEKPTWDAVGVPRLPQQRLRFPYYAIWVNKPCELIGDEGFRDYLKINLRQREK